MIRASRRKWPEMPACLAAFIDIRLPNVQAERPAQPDRSSLLLEGSTNSRQLNELRLRHYASVLGDEFIGIDRRAGDVLLEGFGGHEP
jgi:hypothetical protein